MNDSEQLFTLKKAFLLPHKIGGKCLMITVTVEERINIYNPKYYNCDGYSNENNSCIRFYNITKYFELLPATVTDIPATGLAGFLRSVSIVEALAALDPFFHSLINVISNNLLNNVYYDYDYDYLVYRYGPTPYMYNRYDIYMTVGNINTLNRFRIAAVITDALYVTLSWVSYSFIIILTILLLHL
jgi:hypothetical protein